MVESVSYLHIKPFESGESTGNQHTTITSFEEMLKLASEQEAEESAAEETVSSSGQTEDTELDICFRDPSSGKTVFYEDVAASRTDETQKTTSASSMKTTKYDSYFKEAAEKYGVSESLLKAIAKAESNFNANDVSSAGAIGVMQLMPATAEELGVEDPYDPEQNIMGGAKCIAQKLEEFDGDEELALAAYNAGSGAVKRNGGVPSYCKSYVSKVLSYKEAYETAKAS